MENTAQKVSKIVKKGNWVHYQVEDGNGSFCTMARLNINNGDMLGATDYFHFLKKWFDDKGYKKFGGDFWYTEYGTAYTIAKSAEEAEEIIREKLADSGLEHIAYRCNGRDMGAQDAEEIK